MKSTARLNQVTTLSKILAAVVFISLPFIGFIIGFNYQNELTNMYEACMSVNESASMMRFGN